MLVSFHPARAPMTDALPTADAAPLHTPGRVSALDWSMLVLAIVSIGLLCWETFWSVDDATRRWVIGADYAVCAIFAAEFLWRWRQAGWRGGFVLRNWTDVLGMVPVASPAFRGFRLFRVVRIVILLARFGRAADRAAGAGFTSRLINRISRPLVGAISGSVTIAVLDEVADVLRAGTYTRNVVRALDENEHELRGLIAEKLRQNPRTGRLAMLPFYNDIVDATVDAALLLAREVLNDPRTDELVADVLRENINQLRAAVRQKQRPPSEMKPAPVPGPDTSTAGAGSTN
jgi:hypothetical protein